MQLVCVDRRYQRMNCFNIRELQGVLKRKFFTDLINTNDHRDFLNQSMIGLRFKSNNSISLIPETESFFNFGTTFNAKSKNIDLSNTYKDSTFSLNFINLKSIDASSFFYCLINVFFTNIYLILSSMNPTTLSSIVYIPNQVTLFLSSHLSISQVLNKYTQTNVSINNETGTHYNVFFSTENTSTFTQEVDSAIMFSETSNNARFTKFQNPLISYDYKCGHYLGI
jgi:hypothetical protein